MDGWENDVILDVEVARMQRKSPALVFLFSSALLGLAGCRGTPEPEGPPPPKYGTVRVSCPAAVGAPLVKAYSRSWEALTDGNVVIIPYDPHFEGPKEADVWLLPPAELPRRASAGELRPLPDSL